MSFICIGYCCVYPFNFFDILRKNIINYWPNHVVFPYYRFYRWIKTKGTLATFLKWNDLKKELRIMEANHCYTRYPTPQTTTPQELCNLQRTNSETGVCGRWWTPHRASHQVPWSLLRRGRRSRGRKWGSGRTSTECTPPTDASQNGACGSRCTSARSTSRRVGDGDTQSSPKGPRKKTVVCKLQASGTFAFRLWDLTSLHRQPQVDGNPVLSQTVPIIKQASTMQTCSSRATLKFSGYILCRPS